MNYLISPSPSSTSSSNGGVSSGVGSSDSAVALISSQLSTSCGNMMKRETTAANFGSVAAYIDSSVSASSINVGLVTGTTGLNGLCSPTQTSIRKCFSLIDDFMECHSDYDASDSASKLMFINNGYQLSFKIE